MIDYLIHLHQRGTEPFRSLTALPDEEAERIMRALYRPGSVYWERFEDAAQYLRARRQTEDIGNHLANYVEAQVWNHRPLIEYKRALGLSG